MPRSTSRTAAPARAKLRRCPDPVRELRRQYVPLGDVQRHLARLAGLEELPQAAPNVIGDRQGVSQHDTPPPRNLRPRARWVPTVSLGSLARDFTPPPVAPSFA